MPTDWKRYAKNIKTPQKETANSSFKLSTEKKKLC